MKRPETVEAYIRSKTIRVGKCLLWRTARKGRAGFFQYNNVIGSAPREVYKVRKGPIPEGKCLLHRCDDPRCVAIRHLRPGTKKENRQDFMERHPRAMELCLEAARIGAQGVQRFWDRMSPKERAAFVARRAALQAARRADARAGV